MVELNRKDAYQALQDVEEELSHVTSQFVSLHESLTNVLEENAELEIENQHLRERINQMEAKDDDGEEHLSQSRQNLENLYNEGFHVCSQFYGKHREDGEDCIFCMDIIYGRR